MDEANTDQAAFWNAEAGRNWTRFQADLDAMHGEVTARLMAACAVRPGEAVLDIGCGAGETTLRFAQAAGPDGHALGLDISQALIDTARARSSAAGSANARFAKGDAQTMALPAGAFDLAASRFGVMFFADPVAAFLNIGGALRPGGRTVFVAWAGPEHNPWFGLPSRVGLLADAGFAEAVATTADLRLNLPGGIPAALALQRHIGPIPGVMRARDGTEEDRAAIHAEVAEAFAPFAGPAGLALPARVTIFSARWPG